MGTDISDKICCLQLVSWRWKQHVPPERQWQNRFHTLPYTTTAVHRFSWPLPIASPSRELTGDCTPNKPRPLASKYLPIQHYSISVPLWAIYSLWTATPYKEPGKFLILSESPSQKLSLQSRQLFRRVRKSASKSDYLPRYVCPSVRQCAWKRANLTRRTAVKFCIWDLQ
jgi:hypothetical protein